MKKDTIKVDLEYPRSEGRAKKIIVSLIDTRAADSIVIEYDFERDGWVIKMDETREVDWGMEVVKPEQEVAFIPAWNEKDNLDK